MHIVNHSSVVIKNFRRQGCTRSHTKGLRHRRVIASRKRTQMGSCLISKLVVYNSIVCKSSIIYYSHSRALSICALFCNLNFELDSALPLVVCNHFYSSLWNNVELIFFVKSIYVLVLSSFKGSTSYIGIFFVNKYSSIYTVRRTLLDLTTKLIAFIYNASNIINEHITAMFRSSIHIVNIRRFANRTRALCYSLCFFIN